MKRILACLATIAACSAPVLAQADDAPSAGPVKIDFGDDSGPYANDGECDDPRFEGPLMAESLNNENLGRDAGDCRRYFKQGRIALSPWFAEPAPGEGIAFGDDEGDYANDGECDDIRFARPGSADTIYLVEDTGHDATDCRAAVDAGIARWIGAAEIPEQLMILDDEVEEES